jgi:hypothetical protein
MPPFYLKLGHVRFLLHPFLLLLITIHYFSSVLTELLLASLNKPQILISETSTLRNIMAYTKICVEICQRIPFTSRPKITAYDTISLF